MVALSGSLTDNSVGLLLNCKRDVREMLPSMCCLQGVLAKMGNTTFKSMIDEASCREASAIRK